MKRTETLKVLADLFKCYKSADEFDNVGGVKYAVDGLLRDARHDRRFFNPRFTIRSIDNWAEYPLHRAHFTHSHRSSPISLTNREGTVGSP